MHPSIRLTSLSVLLAATASLFAQNPAPSPAAPGGEAAPRPALPSRRIPQRSATDRSAQPATAPRTLPKPVVVPGGQPPAEGADAPVAPLNISEDGMVDSMEYPNAEITRVIGLYEQLTGKKALYDSSVQGKCGFVAKGPMTKEEAIHVVETVFVLNGFTVVPGLDNIVKILGVGKNARNYAAPIYTDISQLPEGEQVVSFLFKLEYADPTEVLTVINQCIPPGPAAPVALVNSQAVMVTEATPVIRSLAQVISELDRKPAEVVSEFIPLERADAEKVVEKLLKAFEKQQTQGGGTPGQPRQGGAPPGAPAPQGATGGSAAGGFVTLSEDSLIVGKIKLEADTRTNRIHVVTRPINLPFIKMLVAQFDSDIPFAEPVTRPLRFVSAAGMLDIVAGAIADPGVKVESIGGGGGGGGIKSGTPTNTGSPSYGGSDLGTSSRSSSRSSSRGGSSSTGSQGLSEEQDVAPEGRVIGNTKIIADNRSNAIVILGNKQITEKVLRVLNQIDVRTPQVMLTAVIGELTLDDHEEFGVKYLLHKGTIATGGTSIGLGSDLANVLGSDLSLLKNTLSASTMGGGVTGFIGATNSLDILVNALESTGRFRITSRPMIFTSNNRTATISSGQSIPYPGNTLSTYNSGLTSAVPTTQSTVDYIDANLQLQVRPLINSEREVTLNIAQEVNNVSGNTIISGNSVPNITKRSITTSVSVANEATVVLGGLVTENEDKSRSGIPYLDRIPVLGALFSTKTKHKTRTELIVLIRPTVTMGAVEAVKEGERVQEGTNFPPDLEATLDPPGTRVKVEPTPVLICPPKAELRTDK